MQPMAASETQNVLIGNNEGAQRRIPVNSEQFRIKKDGEVAAEDAFFHQYFNSLGKASTKKGKTDKKRAGDDEESVDEDEVWKAMMDSAPDLEGEEEDEDDIDLSELESELDGDDGEVVSDSDGEGVDIDPSFFEESEDDLMQVDATGGDDMGDFAGFESADEMDEPAKKKQSRKEEKKKERKAKKSLPTFASVEDYAKMLEDDGDEDVGTG
jgi:ribosome biogenesis protein MAK21